MRRFRARALRTSGSIPFTGPALLSLAAARARAVMLVAARVRLVERLEPISRRMPAPIRRSSSERASRWCAASADPSRSGKPASSPCDIEEVGAEGIHAHMRRAGSRFCRTP